MEQKQFEEFIHSLGLDTFGMIPLRRLSELEDFLKERQQKNLQNEFEEKEIEKRVNPSLWMDGGKTLISIAFPYAQDGEEEANGFSVYTKRADYHKVVNFYLGQICDYLRSYGFKAEGFVDSNALPERYLAYLAGVGFVGRNNMVITQNYGSFVFLGEVITDYEADCQERRNPEDLKKYSECGECRNCYGECPTKSINTAQINPNICLSYFTQKKEMTNQEMKLLKGNLFGCDFCQLKCPYNQKVVRNRLNEFQTLPFMNEEADVYAEMDNQYFKKYISQTSCGWRGKNVIKRNAFIHMAAEGKDIQQYRGDSPYINEYVKRIQDVFSKKKDS